MQKIDSAVEKFLILSGEKNMNRSLLNRPIHICTSFAGCKLQLSRIFHITRVDKTYLFLFLDPQTTFKLSLC